MYFHINLPLEQHSLSEKRKECGKKRNIDQKYLDILHTWDSLTKMQQIYHWNFQTIYLQLKAKRGKMVIVSNINWIKLWSISHQYELKHRIMTYTQVLLWFTNVPDSTQQCNNGMNTVQVVTKGMVSGNLSSHSVCTNTTWGPHFYLEIYSPHLCCVQHIHTEQLTRSTE